MAAPCSSPARLALAMAGCLLAWALPAQGQTSADWIFHGGTIYTLSGDEPSPVAALAVGSGAVLASGNLEQVQSWRGEATRVIDLDGAVGVPGLVDAHAHLSSLSDFLAQVDLIGTTSAEDCVARARAYAADLDDDAWILGRGWDQNDWAVAEFPSRELLDDAFGNRPVYLRRVDGHAGWGNTAALRRTGFRANMEEIAGGEILRDGAGQLTGVLIDAADDTLRARIPEPSAEELDRRLQLAVQEAASHGLTGIHEMGVELKFLAALQRADAAGQLPVRTVVYLGGDEALARYDGGPVRPGPDARLRVEGVKLYADGALGSRGAALLADYSDRPGHRGLLLAPPRELAHQSGRAIMRRFSVAIHAIGDRGNRVALGALSLGHALAQTWDASVPDLQDLRCRVEHVQVLAPAEIHRFAESGIIPSMQPTHCTSDMPWAPLRVGPGRIAGAYAWRSLLDSGCRIPLGSDFPVEAVSPLLGLYAATTRQAVDGTPEGGWSPEQRFTPLEALLGFTVWAAEAAGVPQWGRLTAGSRADITILSVDPLTARPEELLSAEVVGTMVEGQFTYRHP